MKDEAFQGEKRASRGIQTHTLVAQNWILSTVCPLFILLSIKFSPNLKKPISPDLKLMQNVVY